MSASTGAGVLLTVSGTIPGDLEARVAAGERPQADYTQMSRAFGAELLDYATAARDGGVIGDLLRRVCGRNVQLAWVCWRRRARYRVIVTDGEQVGIPLAFLLKWCGRGPRNCRHAMIVHTLDVPKKRWIFDLLRIQSHIDRFIVYATWQQQFITRRWRIAAHRVVQSPFMVDAQFFAPDAVRPATLARPMICAVGLERRDYPTLMAAVRDLDVDVVIAAASPWSKQGAETGGAATPPNVRFSKFTQFELRQLYADCAFMVVPLQNVTFQAGITAILEALSMSRAVICSRTLGQTDVIVDDENGRYVPPGDVAALRSQIVALLEKPGEATRMGANGRRAVLERLSLDAYVERLAAVVAGVARESGATSLPAVMTSDA